MDNNNHHRCLFSLYTVTPFVIIYHLPIAWCDMSLSKLTATEQEEIFRANRFSMVSRVTPPTCNIFDSVHTPGVYTRYAHIIKIHIFFIFSMNFSNRFYPFYVVVVAVVWIHILYTNTHFYRVAPCPYNDCTILTHMRGVSAQPGIGLLIADWLFSWRK